MHKSLILGARMRNKADKVVELEESIKEFETYFQGKPNEVEVVSRTIKQKSRRPHKPPTLS